MRARLLTKFDLCTGCRICELICSFVHTQTHNPGHARLRVTLAEDRRFNQVEVCIQCDNPACLRVCPRGAIRRDPLTQIVLLSAADCNGCGECIPACPIGMIILPPGAKHPVKCDHCDGDPQCVVFCPTAAILSVDIPVEKGG